jgi:hypothetical protein
MEAFFLKNSKYMKIFHDVQDRRWRENCNDKGILGSVIRTNLKELLHGPNIISFPGSGAEIQHEHESFTNSMITGHYDKL